MANSTDDKNSLLERARLWLEIASTSGIEAKDVLDYETPNAKHIKALIAEIDLALRSHEVRNNVEAQHRVTGQTTGLPDEPRNPERGGVVASAPSSIGERERAALHACEGLDTSDLAGNAKGWLAGLVYDAHRVERDLNSALRVRCPGNGDGDDCIVECQLYEASEQRDPCPPGCCAMADEKDVRALMEAIERDDDGEAPLSARGTPSYADIAGAVARGWCSPLNSHKEMDSELAFAISVQVAALLGLGASTDGGSAAK